MNNKVIIGGLLGGVAFFLLGWLVYGVLLKSYMETNMNSCAMLQMEKFMWWALILSNFVWGFFLAFVFNWSNTMGMSSGLQKGAAVGFMTSLAIDLNYWGTSSMFNSMSAMFVDVAAVTVMVAIAGGVIGWYMGMGKKQA